MTETRNCLSCGRTIRGRADKKFCDDGCRNSFNNLRKQQEANIAYIKQINQVLQKNRKILQQLLPQDQSMQKIPKARLVSMGFHFQYHTHTYTNQKGNTYFFCYDQGWLPLDQEWLLLVRRKSDQL